MAFWRKYRSTKYLNFDYTSTEWKALNSIESSDYVCAPAWNFKKNRFNAINDLKIRYPMTLIVALASRLAEIGVRTTFIIVSSTAALLFEELNQRVEDLAKKAVVDFNEEKISKDLEEWKVHYDLVIVLVEIINRCFGTSLLLACAVDFAVAIIEFQNIKNFNQLNPRYFILFIHAVLRHGSILFSSNRVQAQVMFKNKE